MEKILWVEWKDARDRRCRARFVMIDKQLSAVQKLKDGVCNRKKHKGTILLYVVGQGVKSGDWKDENGKWTDEENLYVQSLLDEQSLVSNWPQEITEFAERLEAGWSRSWETEPQIDFLLANGKGRITIRGVLKVIELGNPNGKLDRAKIQKECTLILENIKKQTKEEMKPSAVTQS